MGKYDYSDTEKEILKVMGLQDSDLRDLGDSIGDTTCQLAELRARIEEVALKKGCSAANAPKKAIAPGLSISSSEIPSWDSLVERANSAEDDQPEIEDFLTEHEIQYTLDEISRINEQFKQKTRLGKVDMAFLVIATLLQT